MTALEFSYNLNETSNALSPFAYRLTQNSEDAKDLIQETVLKAFSNKEKFLTGTNFKAWVFTIMKNLFISGYHKKVRHNTFIDSTDNLHYINSSVNTENLATTGFVLKDINKSIDALSEEYKTPFMMYFRGFKYTEIAEKLDIPLGTVKNRIHIARKSLQDQLKVFRDN